MKEAKSSVIQEDEECKQASIKAEAQYKLCKEWLDKYESLEDYNDLQAIQTLIDQASTSLDFVLEEFTLLKDEHYTSLKFVKDGFESLFREEEAEEEEKEEG